jgi:hypothetical protein
MQKKSASIKSLPRTKKYYTSKNYKKDNVINHTQYPKIDAPKQAREETFSGVDIKDAVMVSNYKVAVARAQIEALSEILIRNKIMTYEEFWKLTNEKIKDIKM